MCSVVAAVASASKIDYVILVVYKAKSVIIILLIGCNIVNDRNSY